MITLKGIAWDHPRGYAGLLAVNDAIAAELGTARIDWQVNSLQDFSAASLAATAERYDLIRVRAGEPVHFQRGHVCLHRSRTLELADATVPEALNKHERYHGDRHQDRRERERAPEIVAPRPPERLEDRDGDRREFAPPKQ